MFIDIFLSASAILQKYLTNAFIVLVALTKIDFVVTNRLVDVTKIEFVVTSRLVTATKIEFALTFGLIVEAKRLVALCFRKVASGCLILKRK